MADELERLPLPAYPEPQQTGTESSLSPWVGDYVVDMLGRGRAAASQPYQAYTGPLTPGISDLQGTAFYGQEGAGGLASLTTPETMGQTYEPMSFTANLETPMTVADPMGEAGDTRQLNTVAEQYMNPYLQASLRPQVDELRRQAELSRIANARRLTDAGAYGGSRQAIMESELDRNLLRGIADVQATGYGDAYDRARTQFNTEEAARRAAQTEADRYGFDVLAAQQAAGATQRGITGEGIAADYKQFLDERDYPLKSAQYMQSLLQNLPMESQSMQYAATDPVQAGMAGMGGGLSLIETIKDIIFPSDIRLKENIKHVGVVNGHSWYTWDWNREGRRLTNEVSSQGVIAQEVIKIKPSAVVEIDGYLHVNYGDILNG